MSDDTVVPPPVATELALRASAARAALNLRILRTIATDLGFPLPAVVDDAIVALRSWSRAGRRVPGA